MTALRRVLRLALALSACAAGAAVAADVRCDKNHYILDGNCVPAQPPRAVAQQIEVLPGEPIGAPTSMASDSLGNVYFTSVNMVYKREPSGRITRLAGNGQPGFAGDNGPATAALLDMPGEDYPEFLIDPVGMPSLPGGIAVDGAGAVYVADAYNERVRRISEAGIVTSVAGGGDGPDESGSPALGAGLGYLHGIAADAAGNVYVSGALIGGLWKVSAEGLLTVIAPTCYIFDSRRLCWPRRMAVGGDGAIYVTEIDCRISKVLDGRRVTIAGRNRLTYDFSTDCGNAPDGMAALDAPIGRVADVALDATGTVYFVDATNRCVRAVDTAGMLRTVAGICQPRIAGPSYDDGPATHTRLQDPVAVTVDAAGNVYIAELRANRIRRVSDGIITTVVPTPLPDWVGGSQ